MFPTLQFAAISSVILYSFMSSVMLSSYLFLGISRLLFPCTCMFTIFLVASPPLVSSFLNTWPYHLSSATKYIYFVTLLEYIFILSTCNEIQYFKTTFTCNNVHLGGNFGNVTKYRYRRLKVSKAIHFFAVNCDLRFYSLLQMIVASPANLCSIKVATNL